MRKLLVAGVLAACALVAATRQPVRAQRAMVVTREDHATQVGVRVLERGGNAVDAAVAVGFALAVTHPAAGNIGGGGFLLVRWADGRATFIDFRERAPEKSTRDMYLDADGKPLAERGWGYGASGVPGTVRGLEYASQKYGSRPWGELVEPAVGLAKGFEVSYDLAESLKSSKKLARFAESRRIFQRDGKFYEPGEKLAQPELAATLERIARHGSKDFYEGETARRLAEEMARNGGWITLADLREYRAVERTPLRGSYRGYEIVTAPPPSAGGAGLVQMLQVLEGTGYEKHGAGSAAAIHYVAEALRRFYADRAAHFADPDFAQIPLDRLLSRAHAEALRKTIRPDRATPSADIRPGAAGASEAAETTHYSIIDAEGTAVAVTYTINDSYGCGATAAGLGFLLNDEMDDFTPKYGPPDGLLQGQVNAVEPRKRPLSSMTPTIVARDGKLHLVLGSPGGRTIIPTVLQVLLNVVDFRMDVQQAVDWPRFHHQWMPDELRLESHGFSPDTIELLRARGHQVVLGGYSGETTRYQGDVAAIQVRDGWLLGAADSRRGGTARGIW